MSSENSLEITSSEGIRLRGVANTRLDTFVDAAFAFGATVLLISSGELPGNYTELVALLKDIPAFILSYFTMMIFWLSHRAWSRNYGLEDKVTIPLTLLLVVSLLVYIYPLKLMYSTLLSFISGGYFPSGIQIASQAEGVSIIGFYGFGFSLLSSSMIGLYWRTYAVRKEMALNEVEAVDAKIGITIWMTLASIALLSGIVSLTTPVRFAVWAGMLYMLIPIVMPLLISRTRQGIVAKHEKTPS